MLKPVKTWSEITDDTPECYREYAGEADCKKCLYRLPCARISAQERL